MKIIDSVIGNQCLFRTTSDRDRGSHMQIYTRSLETQLKTKTKLRNHVAISGTTLTMLAGLAACTALSVTTPVAIAQNTNAPAVSPTKLPAASKYMDALHAEALKSASSIIPHTLVKLDTGDKGDFPYFYKDANGYFNEYTLNLINSTVQPGTDGTPVLSDTSFGVDYYDVLGAMAVKLSKDDTVLLNNNMKKNANATKTLVDAFQSSHGLITQEELKKAGVTQKVDFAMNVIASDWSGNSKDSKEYPLFKFTVLDSDDLAQALPFTPASGQSTLDALANWLNANEDILPLRNMTTSGRSRINALRNATKNPKKYNSSMPAVSQPGAEPEDVLKYIISSASTDIQNDMDNKSRVIEVSMQASASSSTNTQLSIEGGTAFSVPIDFLSFNVSGGASYNTNSFNFNSSSISISMKYEGYSYVPIAPQSYNFTKGWFSDHEIQAAVTNTGKDVSGFHFVGANSFDMNTNGNFGRLSGLLVTNYPTISITYENVSLSEFDTKMHQHSSFGVSVFGIPLGGVSQDFYKATSTTSSSGSGVTLTFKASQNANGTTPMDSRAYVIGGTVYYPGTGQYGK